MTFTELFFNSIMGGSDTEPDPEAKPKYSMSLYDILHGIRLLAGYEDGRVAPFQILRREDG